jgi:hypothetical protein
MLSNVSGAFPAELESSPLKSIEEEALTPVLLPPLRSVALLYDRRGRVILPQPLYGSREILLHQNEMADRDGLDRVRDDADLIDLRRENKLVAIPESDALRVDFQLPLDRRFSRPWTAAFLAVMARDYYASFHSPLQVDSAVRTVAVQQHLERINGNAAAAAGDAASPHLTGQAVDINKGGLTRTQIAWMRTYLQPLIDQGVIDVEEEFKQACFHISVYRNYLPPPPLTSALPPPGRPSQTPFPRSSAQVAALKGREFKSRRKLIHDTRLSSRGGNVRESLSAQCASATKQSIIRSLLQEHPVFRARRICV